MKDAWISPKPYGSTDFLVSFEELAADTERNVRVAPLALSFSTFAPYIGGAGLPAMEINDRRNKPFGPGGSTRRLHQRPQSRQCQRPSAGAKQDRRGRKGRVFSRY